MKLAHTMIRVRDLDRALNFYTGFLGLEETRRKDLGDAILAFVEDEEGNQVELTWNKDGRDYELGNQFGHLAFFTDDLDEIVAEVEERGWDYRGARPETGSKYIFIKDPDGYDIEILERR